MESGFAVYAKSEEEFQDEIIKTLAGKAGTALIYGIMDIRAAADIKKADQLLDIWLCHFAGGGFSGVEPSENRLSEPRLSYNEAIKSAKLEELYRRAYKILYDNRDFLLAVQKELLEHETLLNSDLAKNPGILYLNPIIQKDKAVKLFEAWPLLSGNMQLKLRVLPLYIGKHTAF